MDPADAVRVRVRGMDRRLLPRLNDCGRDRVRGVDSTELVLDKLVRGGLGGV